MPTDHMQELSKPGTAGTDIQPLPRITGTGTVAKVIDDIGWTRQQARDLQEAVGALHQRGHYIAWNDRTGERGRSSAQEMLEELADLGFAWRDVARLVGVSVPAIQKWRRGEGTTGINRQKVASLLAACDLVAEHYGIQEVASWFEMPLLLGIPVAPVDLWAEDRPDLVFDYAS